MMSDWPGAEILEQIELGFAVLIERDQFSIYYCLIGQASQGCSYVLETL
jgi:hypothetical protein